ncbi:MAG TPA: T9SS type A sorting domain-containing protein, partial [Saprospiraceae bacterium]|nr:T9SS type A sorting domain-containing protein [Saprospiraceae bacterium]
ERKGIILNIENQAVTSANEPLEGKGTFRLHQNAPNPFVAETSISFDLPEASDVELLITDQLGRTVRILRGQYPQGRSTMDFKAEELPQGVYRYTLKAGEFSATRTMILVK